MYVFYSCVCVPLEVFGPYMPGPIWIWEWVSFCKYEFSGSRYYDSKNHLEMMCKSSA